MTLIRVLNRSAVTFVLLASLTLVATSTASPPAFGASVARCQETQLDVRWVSGGAGLEAPRRTHRDHFNISSSTCKMTPYPLTVKMTGRPSVLAKPSRERPAATTWPDSADRTPSVPIPVALRAHGGASSSMVEGDYEQAQVGTAIECVYYSSVAVTLPRKQARRIGSARGFPAASDRRCTPHRQGDLTAGK